METQYSAVDATGLVKTFGGHGGQPEVTALQGVSLSIGEGTMTAIVGASGCGKSTLLYALAGLDQPTQGSVTVGGQVITGMKPDLLARVYRDKVGFVFQSFNLVPSLNVLDNVAVSDRLAGRQIDAQRARQILDGLGMLGRETAKISVLSNGQQQRVALARVLYAAPPIVFADEPTGSLDSVNADVVLSQLRHYASTGRTVIMVTHDLDAACLADEVLVMRDGAITHLVVSATPKQLLPLISDTPPEKL